MVCFGTYMTLLVCSKEDKTTQSTSMIEDMCRHTHKQISASFQTGWHLSYFPLTASPSFQPTGLRPSDSQWLPEGGAGMLRCWEVWELAEALFIAMTFLTQAPNKSLYHYVREAGPYSGETGKRQGTFCSVIASYVAIPVSFTKCWNNDSVNQFAKEQ